MNEILSERLTEDKKFTMFFVKFIPKQHIGRFRAGYIHMKNLKTYIDMEKESKEKGIGDKYECSLVLRDVRATWQDNETEEIILKSPLTEVTIFNEDELLTPVFCTYIIDSDNLMIEEETNQDATTKIEISDEEIEKIIDDFGETAVIIQANEFFEMLVKASKEKGYVIDAGKVKYYDYSVNQKERVVNFFEDPNLKKAFVKDNYFEYQNEYRIIILNQSITEPLDFYIGDISDITYERDTRSFFKNLRLSFDKLIDD